MEKESDFLLALKLFAEGIGVPKALFTHSAKAETSAEVKRFCASTSTTLKTLEQGTPWDKLSESFITILNYSVSKYMTNINMLVS